MTAQKALSLSELEQDISKYESKMADPEFFNKPLIYLFLIA